MSTNRFDLLQDDNEEPQEKVVTKEVKPAVKAPTAPASKKPAAAAAPAKPTGERRDRPQGGDRERRPRDPSAVAGAAPNGERRERRERRPTDAVATEDADKQSTRRDSKPRTHTPRTDAAGNPRGRLFDRKSGTGRPQGEQKKGGSGRGNWGTPTEVVSETPATEEEATTTTTTTTESVDAPVAEPKDTNITYDEYLKQQQAVQVEPIKLRQAGEGETNKWDDYAPLQKEPVKSNAKSDKKEKKNPKEKTIINLEQKPAVSQSSAPKGKGPRPTGAKEQAKKIPETKDFPALKA
ncbi:hypothetical protein SAMD00019534_000970 [Acytostelium subglobosum LB1]|uniref:hypothetical protein n=1 Tax=Acytostelium subglobosum LB1 TaxID=1410327 RepID=UPI000644EE57|nr:hypothetical protein SAMD00019534_000970 [Acytostelium subglobosum LB1]GAM16922.1 hypothetical protein SAMD00019534_000970 [Acytostelium subglobosum LB1]|eukprot:XP_012758984.1 hypothetical protein SAMD00019534_000970 [Acytostelium subglobosum LB1]